MGAVVSFDWAGFQAMFPEMEAIGETLAETYFQIATTIHRNDGGGPIGNATLQARLLNMLIAHIAQLYAPRDAAGNVASSGSSPPPNVTGRVSSASEGSVSVTTEALKGFETAEASWLSQTRYGQLYWVATSSFRTMRYRSFYDIRRLTH
jgi:hypothetical protein